MPDGLRAYFEDSTEPETIHHLLDTLTATIETNLPPIAVHEANDSEPMLIGTRFVLVPANRIVLPIDAAMAFGSGRHESTQLCLEALEQYVKPGQTVFDIGCGSGILSLAAQKLGAAVVIGADIDESAISVARRHFSGPLFAGSADGFPSHAADLVLCNISGKVADHLAADLQRIAKPSGLVIIAGFTTQTAPSKFRAQHVISFGDWECCVCNPADITIALEPDPNQHEARWWI
jgi:ribosomal protein L11 methylase PrmA